MSEINNLPKYNGKIEKQLPVQPKAAEIPVCNDEECIECNEKTNVIPDLGVLGQSQVKKPDNLNADLEFLTKNPELVEISDKYFETTLARLEKEGDPNAYENACLLQSAFAKELCTQ